MKAIITLTFLSLLVAVGVIFMYALPNEFQPLHSLEVIAPQDFDESTRDAYHYVKAEFVQPLRNFREDYHGGKTFTRSGPIIIGSGLIKPRLFALNSGDENVKEFVVLEADEYGRFIGRPEDIQSLSFKVKFSSDPQEVFLQDVDGSWGTPGENRKLYSLLLQMDETGVEAYFSSEFLNGGRRKRQIEAGEPQVAQADNLL